MRLGLGLGESEGLGEGLGDGLGVGAVITVDFDLVFGLSKALQADLEILEIPLILNPFCRAMSSMIDRTHSCL